MDIYNSDISIIDIKQIDPSSISNIDRQSCEYIIYRNYVDELQKYGNWMQDDLTNHLKYGVYYRSMYWAAPMVTQTNGLYYPISNDGYYKLAAMLDAGCKKVPVCIVSVG